MMSDGDTALVLPLFTDEAKQEAREKFNPLSATSKNFQSTNSDEPNIALTLDAVATIYAISK